MQVLADLEEKKKKGKPKICSSGLPVVGTCLPAKQRNNFIILVLENFLTVGSKDTEHGEDRGNLIRRWYIRMPFQKR